METPVNSDERPISAHVLAAVERVNAMDVDPLRKAEAFVDLAIDLQKQPRHPQELVDALHLYELAEEASAAAGDELARARAIAGKGSALRRMPGGGAAALDLAQTAFRDALPVLREHGADEEVAEVEMSLGLVLHALANAGRAPINHSVQAYHRALRTFTREAYPREFAILHNNLATAYLGMRMDPEKGAMREALAVQSFREALRVVTLEEDPVEFAMLQNNLGNALQAMRSSHPLENLARAVEAYDEALKVRTAHDMPVEHANTLVNKANALMNLPDGFMTGELVDGPNVANLDAACGLLREARSIFHEHGYGDRAQLVAQLLGELERDLLQGGGAPSEARSAEDFDVAAEAEE
ncbi:MAG: hypothetical protein AAGH15_13750 [Myxococcota bacterium]